MTAEDESQDETSDSDSDYGAYARERMIKKKKIAFEQRKEEWKKRKEEKTRVSNMAKAKRWEEIKRIMNGDGSEEPPEDGAVQEMVLENSPEL